jgi:hypothetical protein
MVLFLLGEVGALIVEIAERDPSTASESLLRSAHAAAADAATGVCGHVRSRDRSAPGRRRAVAGLLGPHESALVRIPHADVLVLVSDLQSATHTTCVTTLSDPIARPPTYSMRESSLTMQCNGSGWSSPARGAEFGIVSYDWSNDKKDWAMAQPMDAEERLLHQATLTHAANPKSKIFVYRNLVWAMPWFSSVREKLDDPACESEWLVLLAPHMFPAPAPALIDRPNLRLLPLQTAVSS